MLSFDYEKVREKKIRQVAGIDRQISNDGTISYSEVAFELEGDAILLSVDSNTDELKVSLRSAADIVGPKFPIGKPEFKEIAELAECVGKTLGWCWIGRNYLGYLDFFVLSVSGLEPDFCFIGISSQIQLGSIQMMRVAPTLAAI